MILCACPHQKRQYELYPRYGQEGVDPIQPGAGIFCAGLYGPGAGVHEMWAEAKKKCRLNNEDIALAKRLGLNPRSLIKNIPNKSERPVH